jgi:uncharacterized protein (TIGR03435 family)
MESTLHAVDLFLYRTKKLELVAISLNRIRTGKHSSARRRLVIEVPVSIVSPGIRFFVAAALSAMAISAQPQSLPTRTEFEVASVKPTASADGRSLLQAVPGRLLMRNLALRRLILIAWDLQDDQLAGDAPWIDSGHYDIQATASPDTTVQQMEGPMLQALLEERFRLTIHREIRQLSVYELAVAKDGPKLQPSKDGSCTPRPVNSPPASNPNFCGFHSVPDDGLNRTLEGTGITTAALAETLSRTYVLSLGKNIIDATGLTGAFDVHLRWAIDPLSSPTGPDTSSSIFAALQEQLGLKLESAKAPVEVLVIDHIEKPSAN